MEQINAIGRRKSAVARVYLTEGTGKITINKRDITEYFPSGILQYVVKQPLHLLDVAEKYDIKANLDGGGFTGQTPRHASASSSASVNVWLDASLRGSASLAFSIQTHKTRRTGYNRNAAAA